MASRRLKNPALFICDLQEKFRPAIHEFATVVSTTQKLLRAAKILQIPVFATTQMRDKLGQTCPELELDSTYPTVAHVDKSAFSMWVPGVRDALQKTSSEKFDVLIVGIETHICVLQTTLDLLSQGHRVWLVQDGVSSCNEGERGVAIERARQEGARVTTSESVIYECVGDAGDDAFKQIAKLVKESTSDTKIAVQRLCKTAVSGDAPSSKI